MIFKRIFSRFALPIALLIYAVSPASATTTDLVILAAHGAVITTNDLKAEILKAPPEARASMLQNRDALAQLASNLLMRRVLANQAISAGLADEPINQSSLILARDRVLSEVQLNKLDKINKPTAEILEQRAHEMYRADTNRFEVPEEIRVSHILIAKGETAEVDAKELLAALRSGKNFEEAAKEKSADPGSSVKGGDLGFFSRGRMVKPFEDAAFALKTGELSNVVETQFGFHIIKVTDRKNGGKKPYDEVKVQLYREVAQKIYNDARMKAGQEIMSTARGNPEALEAFMEQEKNHQ